MAIEIKVNVNGEEGITKLADNVSKTSESVKSLKQQFIDARKELMNMDESDPGFLKKAAEAGKLKDQIADMNAVIKATAGSTTENLGNALTGVASIGIGAFQGIASAQALFGSESEDLQKVLVKLQAAANMADAIKSFGQFGDTMTQVKASLGAVATAMFGTTTATQAEVVATEEATVAQIGLNTAMLANPIFLVIAALGALTAAYFYFTSASDEAAEAEKKRQKEIDARRKAQEKAAKEESKELASMQSAYALQIGMLSKTNAGSKERLNLINSINKEYGTSLKNIQDEAKFQDQLSDSLEKYLLLKRVEFQVKKNDAYFESLMAKENDARKAIAKEKIKISEDDIRSILKVQDAKERASKMEQILLAKNADRNLSTMAPEVKALIDLRLEQERVSEATFKLQNTKDKLITTTFNGNNQTKEEIQLNHDLKNTLDSLIKQNEEYGKSQEDMALLQKIRRDAEIEAQYKLSTDKDKDAQKEKALAQSKIVYDNQITDINTKNTETKKQKEKELYDSIKDIGKSVAELRKEKYDEDLKNLDAALANKLITEEDYLNKSEALRLNYQADIKKIDDETATAAKAITDKQLDETLAGIDKRHEKIQEYLDGMQNIAGAFFAWGDRMREDDSEAELSKYKEGTVEYENAKKKQTEIAEKAAERQFYINKAFQLGSAINDATGAILTSLKSSPPVIGITPNPAGIAALAFVTATGIANIAKIAASKYKSNSTGGPSNTTPNLGAGPSSTPSYNLFGNNNNANTVNATPMNVNVQNEVKVKAYVSETEITDSQKRIARYQNSATL